MAVKRDTPKVTQNDILTAVAHRTNLTKDQVKEMFKAYSEILLDLSSASNKPIDFAICLPYLGYFQYKRWTNSRTKPTGALKYFTNDGLVEANLNEIKTNAEYDRLVFFLNNALQKEVKAKSIEQIAQAKRSKELTERDYSDGK